jgi:hypothetical protein
MMQERAMSNHAASVSHIVDFDEHSQQSDAVLRLEDKNSYSVSKQDPRFAVWARIIRERQASHGSLYVEYDPATFVIKALFLPSVRQIEFVAPQPEGNRLRVTIFMAPSLYFIDTTRPNYQQLKQSLEQSARTKSEISVTTHPDTLEILDARPLPPGAVNKSS